MGSTGLDFVCGRCWLPSPFSGYHVDGTDFLACGRCVELMLRLDKDCKKAEQEAKTHASSEEETLAEIAVIEECRSTAPKMEASLRAPGKLAHWQPHVRAVADAVKWAETLPEPDAIDKVLDEVGKVTITAMECVPVPCWVIKRLAKKRAAEELDEKRCAKKWQGRMQVLEHWQKQCTDVSAAAHALSQQVGLVRDHALHDLMVRTLDSVSKASFELSEVVPPPAWVRERLAQSLEEWKANR